MRFRTLLTNGAIVIGAAVILSLPLFVGNAALALLAFVPWFMQLRTGFKRSCGWLTAAIFGFLVGIVRAGLICSPMLLQASRPFAAIVLGLTYVGLFHGIAATITVLLLRRISLWRCTASALLIPLLDAVWCWPVDCRIPYLTAIYLAAGSSRLLRFLPYVGPFGLSGLVGIGGLILGLAFVSKNSWRFAAAVTVIIIAVADAGPRQSPNAGTRTFRLLALNQASGWNERAAQAHQQLDLIVLPECSVIAAPATPADSKDLGLDQLIKEHYQFHPATAVLAGVVQTSGDGDGTFRNRAVLLSPSGSQSWSDKRTPVPGEEVIPFAGWPIIGRVFGLLSTSDSILIPGQTPDRPILVGDVSIAIAICYDHSVPIGEIAWGVMPGSDVKLLVCVARTSGLGFSDSWERAISQRARKLHAVLFNCPVLYVTDTGSELVLSNGDSRWLSAPEGALWTLDLQGPD